MRPYTIPRTHARTHTRIRPPTHTQAHARAGVRARVRPHACTRMQRLRALVAPTHRPAQTWTRWDSPRGGAEECKSTPSARRHRPRPPRGHVMAWEPLPHRYSPGGRARRAVGSSASAQFIVQPINSTAYSSVQSSAVELNGKKQVGTTCDPSVCNASRVRGSSAQVLVSVSKVIRGSNAPSPLGLNDLWHEGRAVQRKEGGVWGGRWHLRIVPSSTTLSNHHTPMYWVLPIPSHRIPSRPPPAYSTLQLLQQVKHSQKPGPSPNRVSSVFVAQRISTALDGTTSFGVVLATS